MIIRLNGISHRDATFFRVLDSVVHQIINQLQQTHAIRTEHMVVSLFLQNQLDFPETRNLAEA